MNRQERYLELARAAVRVVFGASLALFHGYGKVFGGKMPDFVKSVTALGFPKPTFFAWCAALSELVGGTLVALGLLTRPAAAFAGFTMVVALYRHRVDPFAKSELAILYLVVMIACVVGGGGRYSLDELRAKR
jgi:putative oxidoreductase